MTSRIIRSWITLINCVTIRGAIHYKRIRIKLDSIPIIKTMTSSNTSCSRSWICVCKSMTNSTLTTINVNSNSCCTYRKDWKPSIVCIVSTTFCISTSWTRICTSTNSTVITTKCNSTSSNSNIIIGCQTMRTNCYHHNTSCMVISCSRYTKCGSSNGYL